MTEFDLYIILKLDAIIAFFGVTAICLAAFSVINFIIWGVNSECETQSHNKQMNAMNSKKRAYTSFPIAFLLFFISIAIPSTKEIAIIKVIPIIAKSEALHKVTGDAKELYDLGIKATKDYIKSMNKNGVGK